MQGRWCSRQTVAIWYVFPVSDTPQDSQALSTEDVDMLVLCFVRLRFSRWYREIMIGRKASTCCFYSLESEYCSLVGGQK